MDLHCAGNELSRRWSRKVTGVTQPEGKAAQTFQRLMAPPAMLSRTWWKAISKKKKKTCFHGAMEKETVFSRLRFARWEQKKKPSEHVQQPGWSWWGVRAFLRKDLGDENNISLMKSLNALIAVTLWSFFLFFFFLFFAGLSPERS